MTQMQNPPFQKYEALAEPKQKHTQGPWKAICEDVTGHREVGDSGLRFWSITEENAKVHRGSVCSVFAAPHINGISIEERNANAALIAAAPDLLEALKYVVDNGNAFITAIEAKDSWVADFEQWSVSAKAAIAKAEGR